MKLVYIWIEEYRNIFRKGFNFSGEGKFTYSDENGTLNFEKNQNYISDFFHPKISNITGLIGKNGTGKSNILELINYILKNPNSSKLSSFFFIMEEENTYKLYQYKSEGQIVNQCGFNIEIIPYLGTIKGVTCIYFSNVFDNRNNLFSKETIDLSLNRFGRTKFGENIHTHQQEEIRNQIKFVNSKYFYKIRNEDLKIPKTIVLSSPLWLNLKNKAQLVERRYGVLRLMEFYQRYRPRFRDAKSDRSFNYYTSFLIFLNIFLTPFGKEYDESPEISRGGYHFDNEQVKQLNFILKEILDGEFNIKELHQFIITTFCDDFLSKNSSNNKFLIEFLRTQLNDSLIYEFFIGKTKQGSHSKGRLKFELNFENGRCKDFLNLYFKAIGNITLYNFDWGGISSGEKAFLSLFSRFHSIIRRVRQKHVIICIDEGDLYFHPKWQLEFLNYLINFLPEIFGDRKLQIVLTTHSPFLVSDLPKEYLIFIDSYDDGTCNLINENNIEMETFGGNINMLYTKTFFLKNGTIGRFAFNKLIEVIKSLKGEDSSISNLEAKTITKIIGDPIIKNQLNKMIND